MEPIGLVAVVFAFSVPLAGIYAWYRVRKLRTEERWAAIAKGVSVPIAEELPPHARSRKAAILLIAGGLGYTLTFMWLSRFETEAMQAAVFGIIPVSIGIGYFIDAVLVLNVCKMPGGILCGATNRGEDNFRRRKATSGRFG